MGSTQRGGGSRVGALIALVFGLLVLLGCGGGSDGSSFVQPGSHDGGGGEAGPPTPGPLGGDGGAGAVTSLWFEPATATVRLNGTNMQTASFTLKAKLGDGTTMDVTAQSVQFDRPDLATLTTGEPVVMSASGPYAGVGTLHAIYGGHDATAKLTVQMSLVVVGPGVSQQVVSALGGANLPPDPAVTSLLYPYDKTYFPLGISSPLVMWNAPNANDVYRLHYEEQNYTFDGYYAVAPPAQLRADQTVWDPLTASNGGDPLLVRLSRWDATTQTAYASAGESWTIVGASLRGAIYYWTTSSGGHMSRIRPGTGAQPEVLNGGKCMGCHAVSADGSTLVAAVEGAGSTSGSPPAPNQTRDQADGRPWVTFGLPSVTAAYTANSFAGNVAVNPDGKYVVFGDQRLYLADTASGQLFTGSGIDNVPLDPGMGGVMTPAFSPDGKHLAVVEGSGDWYHDLVGGKLLELDFDEASHTFTNPRGLAPASSFPAAEQAIAYPSFTPDAQSIAFHVGNYTTGCNPTGCGDTTTQSGALWMQTTSGGSAVRLDTLTDSSGNPADHDLSFEPTFNPVARGGYFWVVFTSSRDWGNRVTGTPDNGKKRLWVAAVETGPVATDPSHPAFFLEGQEETTTNMRGFWALAACTPTQGGGSCQAGFECCSGFCDRGTCVDTGQVSCQGLGGACMASADCCNSSVVICQGGMCAAATK